MNEYATKRMNGDDNREHGDAKDDDDVMMMNVSK